MTTDRPLTGMDAVAVHLRRQAANIARQHPRCATCGEYTAFGRKDGDCHRHDRTVGVGHYCADHTEVQP